MNTTMVYWVAQEKETESAIIHIKTPEKVDYIIVNGVKFKLIKQEEK